MKILKELMVFIVFVVIFVCIIFSIVTAFENRMELKYELNKKIFNDNDKYESRIYYSSYNDKASCSVNIEKEKYYKDITPKEYIEDTFTYNLKDKISGIKKANINNKKWYYISKKNNEETIDLYVTNYKKDIYIVEYKIYDYSNGEKNIKNSKCYKEKNKFLKSLKFN